MKSILFGVIFWAVLLVMIWLIRPKSKLLGITMERWSMAHRLVTILVLAALIGSSSYLMTLCPMWNGEITAQLMEEIEARKAEQAASDEAVKNSDSPAVTAGEEKWEASATDVMRANANSDQRDRFAIKNKNQYELMADALLKGQLYLEYGDMDPRLLAMENPYDTNARRELGIRYHWDHAFYKGRYYMYFGVVPVFLLFIPYKLITGVSLTTYHATQVFVGLSMIGLFAFFRLLSKRLFPKLSFLVYLFLGAAVSITSVVHCVAKPAMYMTAFAAGFCMEIWSVYFFVKAVWATENENRAIFRAFLGALFGALAFGCRPSIALGNLVVIPCLIVFLREHKFTGKLFLKLVAAASPYFIIGALLMLYNYARFENPFEFGQSYQLTVADQTSYGSLLSRLSVRKLLNGAIYFLIRTEDLVGEFPHIVEGGVFFSYPVFGAGLFALTSKKVRTALRTNKLVLFTLGTILTIGVIILMDGVWTPYLLTRYKEDMMWLLGMLVFLMVGLRYADGSGAGGSAVGAAPVAEALDPAPAAGADGAAVAATEVTEAAEVSAAVPAASPCEEAREFSSAVCLLAIYSIFVCAFVFVQLDMEFFLPEQIEVIKKIIGGITFGL